jgi:hypothetical protein
MSNGDLVLFTGAGFSLGAVSVSGETISSAGKLKDELWRLAFPSTPDVDDASSLGDLFDLAVARARNATRDLLKYKLTVDAVKTPERYRTWFSFPWYRHYTLNIDDLDEAVAARYELPRQLQAISGNNEAATPPQKTHTKTQPRRTRPRPPRTHPSVGLENTASARFKLV